MSGVVIYNASSHLQRMCVLLVSIKSLWPTSLFLVRQVVVKAIRSVTVNEGEFRVKKKVTFPKLRWYRDFHRTFRMLKGKLIYGLISDTGVSYLYMALPMDLDNFLRLFVHGRTVVHYPDTWKNSRHNSIWKRDWFWCVHNVLDVAFCNSIYSSPT